MLRELTIEGETFSAEPTPTRRDTRTEQGQKKRITVRKWTGVLCGKGVVREGKERGFLSG